MALHVVMIIIFMFPKGAKGLRASFWRLFFVWFALGGSPSGYYWRLFFVFGMGEGLQA